MERRKIRTGRPPKEQAEALGDHVIMVADALFIEHGYSATSMATIAARARVGKQTLYRRFPDKGALFREVVRRRIDATIPPRVGAAGTRDPLAALKALGRAALDVILDPEFLRLYRIIIGEALSFPELACSASDHFGSSFVELCVEAIRQAQAVGICRPGDPVALADCFIWSLIGDAFLKGLSGLSRAMTKRERDAHLETAWRVFIEGVKTGPTGRL